MSMSSQTLLKIDEIKSFLKTRNDEDDAVLEMIADGVSEAFSRFTKRTLMTKTLSEYICDGNGLVDLYLPNWPVTTLTSLYESDALLVIDVDYKIDMSEGRLQRLGEESPVWPDGTRNLKMLNLVSGYTITATDTRPFDLKLAALKQVGAEYQRFVDKTFNEINRSLSGQSTSLLDKEFAIGVEDVLRRHMRV